MMSLIHIYSRVFAMNQAQAQECVFESKVLGGVQDGMKNHITVAHEAAAVSLVYQDTHRLMTVAKVKDYVPFSWLSMVDVKMQYFRALSYYHTATAVLDQPDSGDLDTLRELFSDLHLTLPGKREQNAASTLPNTGEARRELGRFLGLILLQFCRRKQQSS